MSGVARNMLSN